MSAGGVLSGRPGGIERVPGRLRMLAAPGCPPAAPRSCSSRAARRPAGTNYTQAGLWGPPKLPVGGLYRAWVRIDRGSATSVPLARHQILLDANFHADDPGKVLKNDTGPWTGQLAVDTRALGLAPGWHKLVMQGKAVDPATGATNTGSLALFFEVVAGAPAACGVPLQTHATADSTLYASTTTVVRGTSAPRVKSAATPRVGTALELRPQATTVTPLVSTTGGTRTVTATSYARLTFDLAWLPTTTQLSAASVWVYVARGPTTAAGVAVTAYDATAVDAYGAPLPGSAIGGGVLPAAPESWAEIKLDVSKLATAGGLAREVRVALALDGAAPGAYTLLASSSKGAPLLLVTPAC